MLFVPKLVGVLIAVLVTGALEPEGADGVVRPMVAAMPAGAAGDPTPADGATPWLPMGGRVAWLEICVAGRDMIAGCVL